MTDREKWVAFTFLAIGQFMLILDATIVNVALPSIQKAFGLSLEGLQWIVTAYSLSFGGFLLLGGRAADIFGRKRVFLTGLVGFISTSLLIGLLSNGSIIAILRAVQGLSGAFMAPAALSIVLTTFQEQTQRSKALSIWGGISAAGGSFGLVIGGFLTQFLDWRWNFFVNVPLGIVVLFAVSKLVPPHSSEERSKKIDLLGAGLVTGGLMLLVYTITNANSWGWISLQTIGMLVGSLILLAGFIFNESRVSHPLMPLSIFKIGNVASANLQSFIVAMTAFAPFFFLTIYNQGLNGYSPLQSGFAGLPTGIIIGIMATQAPRLIKKFGIKKILMFAPIPIAIGLYLLTGIPLKADFVSNELPGLIIWPLGLGLSFVTIIIAATSGIPPQESGLASGMINTFQQIGLAIGVAILSTIDANKTTSYMAMHSPSQLALASANLEGIRGAFFAAMIISVVAFISAALFIRDTKVDPKGQVAVGA